MQLSDWSLRVSIIAYISSQIIWRHKILNFGWRENLSADYTSLPELIPALKFW